MSRSTSPCTSFLPGTSTPDFYTLSLHDALPISHTTRDADPRPDVPTGFVWGAATSARSEEHTSELQSRENLVCRLLLEKNIELPDGEGFFYLPELVRQGRISEPQIDDSVCRILT